MVLQNIIVDSLSYGKISQSKTFKVILTPNTPTFTFPSTWITNFSDSTGMSVSGTGTLTMDTNYELKQVLLSVDNNGYLPQTFTNNNDGTYSIALKTKNPDIGTSLVNVKFIVIVNGREKVYQFNDSFSVAPVFDCNDTSLMSPSNDMIQENKFERKNFNKLFMFFTRKYTMSQYRVFCIIYPYQVYSSSKHITLRCKLTII